MTLPTISINPRIALSIATIGASAALLVGATVAVFTDSVTQDSNTFAVGNGNLQIAPDTVSGPGVFVESIDGPSFNGMFPGQTKTFDFWLKNSSDAAIDLDLVADVTAITDPIDENDAIDNVLLVSWLCDQNGNGILGDETPTSEFSPRDWFNGGNASLGSLIPNEQMFCQMTGRIPSSADDSISGETVIFDVEYGATQVTPAP